MKTGLWHRLPQQIFGCFYLMVSPESSQSVGIHYPEYFGFFVLPSDEVFVPAVREQLIDVIPKQSTVYRGERESAVENVSVEAVTRFRKRVCNRSLGLVLAVSFPYFTDEMGPEGAWELLLTFDLGRLGVDQGHHLYTRTKEETCSKS